MTDLEQAVKCHHGNSHQGEFHTGSLQGKFEATQSSGTELLDQSIDIIEVLFPTAISFSEMVIESFGVLAADIARRSPKGFYGSVDPIEFPLKSAQLLITGYIYVNLEFGIGHTVPPLPKIGLCNAKSQNSAAFRAPFLHDPAL